MENSPQSCLDKDIWPTKGEDKRLHIHIGWLPGLPSFLSTISQVLSRALKRPRMNGEETTLYMTVESVH